MLKASVLVRKTELIGDMYIATLIFLYVNIYTYIYIRFIISVCIHTHTHTHIYGALQVILVVKNPPALTGDGRREQ